jgi:hypothetical protein
MTDPRSNGGGHGNGGERVAERNVCGFCGTVVPEGTSLSTHLGNDCDPPESSVEGLNTGATRR